MTTPTILNLSASGICKRIKKLKRSADVLGFELVQLISADDDRLFLCELSTKSNLGFQEYDLLAKTEEFLAEIIKA